MRLRFAEPLNYYSSSPETTLETEQDSPSMRQIISATIMGMRVASICLFAYWGALFVATHLPSVPVPPVASADKICHFIAFSGLAFLLAWALPKSHRRPLRHVFIAFGIAIGYGLFDELSQSLVSRSTELWDFFADCIGAAAGLTAYLFVRKYVVNRLMARPLSNQPMVSRST